VEGLALFVRDGDGYVGTSLTQGGWDPGAANGGTVLALLGQHLHGVPALVPMGLSRFTADLVRPVPLGRRLHVEHRLLREGKKIQLVELLLLVDGVEHVRATALRVREADLRAQPGLPASTTDDRPAAALTPPEATTSLRDLNPSVPEFLRGVDMRKASGPDGSPTGSWVRLEAEVVAGEGVNPTARLAFAFDFANLIGVVPEMGLLSMINPDVTAHVLRPPVGEWVAVTGDTRFQATTGRGVSTATLSDLDGPFAFASTSQILQPRPG
jgi:hypothetical protein